MVLESRDLDHRLAVGRKRGRGREGERDRDRSRFRLAALIKGIDID